jgi:hypothetical protein
MGSPTQVNRHHIDVDVRYRLHVSVKYLTAFERTRAPRKASSARFCPPSQPALDHHGPGRDGDQGYSLPVAEWIRQRTESECRLNLAPQDGDLELFASNAPLHLPIPMPPQILTTRTYLYVRKPSHTLQPPSTPLLGTRYTDWLNTNASNLRAPIRVEAGGWSLS